MRNLRVIANLYAERLRVVARKGAGIDAIGDLAGKRVSLDEPGSGTLLMARMLLDAYGLAESDLVAEFLKAGPAASLMHRGELDAFFIVAGCRPTRLRTSFKRESPIWCQIGRAPCRERVCQYV